MKGFFITGTDTGVGKTEVAAYLVKKFSEKGLKVGVMKPVATGSRRLYSDAKILKECCRSKDSIQDINPVSLRLPLAPLVASMIQKRKIDMKLVWGRFRKLSRDNDVLIVEGIGGVMVPICRRGKRTFYVLDMISKMKLPAVIVSRPNLGTINHTLMTVKMLQSKRIKIAGIIFDYTSGVKKDLSVKTNPEVIEELSGIRILGTMHYNKNRTKRRIKWLREIES